MKNKEKFYSTTLASIALVLFLLILVSFDASTATAQSDSPIGPFAYITNTYSNNVSVIDTATNTVTATVDVGYWPVGAAVTPDGKKVYVTNLNSDNVSVIDITTNTVTATILVGNGPEVAAVTPDGKKVYVTNFVDGTVSVIDTTKNTVIATVDVGYWPEGVVVTPDGSKVYVANEKSDNVSVIDTATNTITDTVKVGVMPSGVTVNPKGTEVYVTNYLSNNISIIDTATNVVTATVNTGVKPFGIAITPDGTKVYVSNAGDAVGGNPGNTVSVINITTKTVTATVNVGQRPTGIAVTPDGTKVYVTNSGAVVWGNTVSVINIATNNVTATVPVGYEPNAYGQFIGPEASITVISPNGGENWQVGTNQEIKWKYTGNPGSYVKIELLKGEVSNSIIASFAWIGNDNNGSYKWLIPENQMPGDNYKVSITSTTNPAYNNSSTGNFIIGSPSPVCNTSTIFGYSFNDSNGNKIMDEGEDGLSNWTINLNGFDTCEGMLINKTMETNSTGYFAFENANPGVYVLSENSVVGWFPTTDAAYTLNVPLNSTSIRKDFGNSNFTS